MLFLHNINSVAKYESKVLVRSWFFKIFSFISVALVVLVNAGMTLGGGGWALKAVSSNFPYLSLLMLNVGQAIIAIFLSSEFLKRDKKLDTSEVFYVRPLSNAEYVFGKIWGNLRVFLLLNVIVLAITLVFNFIAPGTVIDWGSYLSYFLIISVPTLIYIIGLSILSMLLIGNQAVTFVVLLGYIGLTMFYIGDKLYHLFDYMGFHIPMFKSLIVGFSNLPEIVVHRAAYLFLGLACILFSIKLFKRLPNSPTSVRPWFVLAFLMLGIGVYCIYGHVENSLRVTSNKKFYTEINNKYVSSPKIVVDDYSIDLIQKTSGISAVVEMKGKAVESSSEFVFCLNPALDVQWVRSGSTELKFTRDEQILVVDMGRAVAEDEEVVVTVAYEGTIDETLCYLDIEDEVLFAGKSVELFNVDKKYFLQTPNYLILTPETYWYPRPGTAYSDVSLDWQQTYFSNFKLKVKTRDGLTAISQGEPVKDGEGAWTFSPDFPMQAASVVVGNYENLSTTVDSVTYNVWVTRGDDYFSSVFDSISDTIGYSISRLKTDMELTYKLDYPFKNFSLIEVPAQFTSYSRAWTQAQEVMQPEMVFLPEKGLTIMGQQFDFASNVARQKQFARNRGELLSDKQIQLRVFENAIRIFQRSSGGMSATAGAQGRVEVTTQSNPYFFFPQLYNFRYNVYSPRWTMAGRVVEVYLQNISANQGGWMRNVSGMTNEEKVNALMKDHSFLELMSDVEYRSLTDNIISMNAGRLFGYAELDYGVDRFRDTMFTVMKSYNFDNIEFEALLDTLGRISSTDLNAKVYEWENPVKLPGYQIAPPSMIYVSDRGEEVYQMEITMSNISDYPGMVRMDLMGGMRMASEYSVSSEPTRWMIALGARESKTIVKHFAEVPRGVVVNTMMSVNLPSVVQQELTNILEENRFALREPGETVLMRNPFELDGEIVVDNEDSLLFSLSKAPPSGYLPRIFAEADTAFLYEGMGWRAPFEWTATTDAGYYGKAVRSAYVIRGGNGSQWAEWKIPVPEPGRYDLYYYVRRPNELRQGQGRGGFGGGGRGPGGPGGGGRGPGGQQQQQQGGGSTDYNFTLEYDGAVEDAYLDVRRVQDGWARVGFTTYNINSDTVVVRLTDKTGLSSVTADAVKLEKR